MSVHTMQLLLNDFPAVQAAFGYGSGMFSQPLSQSPTSAASPMLDFIFAVESPLDWHQQNIALNRGHYSCLAALGPRAVAGVAERIGAGVHFNAFVPWRHQLLKYGVVQTAALSSDLKEWHHLYIAGRLQKPVLHLKRHASVDEGISCNLDAALRVALLLLPARFSTQQLLESLCGISYVGDIRMAFAEDINKVRNIVHGSRDGLEQLYGERLRDGLVAQEAHLTQTQPEQWVHCSNADTQALHISQLPKGILSLLNGHLGSPLPLTGAAETRKLATGLAGRPDLQQLLRRSIGQIVRASSRRQAVAGVFAAGAWRSVQYGTAKLVKAWQSRL